MRINVILRGRVLHRGWLCQVGHPVAVHGDVPAHGAAALAELARQPHSDRHSSAGIQPQGGFNRDDGIRLLILMGGSDEIIVLH